MFAVACAAGAWWAWDQSLLGALILAAMAAIALSVEAKA